MPSNRVVITGLGIISPSGKTIDEFWTNIKNGNPGIGPIQQLDVSNLKFKKGAEIKNFNPSDYFSVKESSRLNRFSQFGLIAAEEAIKNSGIHLSENLNNHTAVVTGTSIGGISTVDDTLHSLYWLKKKRVSPLGIPVIMPNALTSNIGMRYGFKGPSFTLTTACASSNHAIAQAFNLIRNNGCERAIVGGSEAPFTFGFLKLWEAMKIVSMDTCRPFSKERDGIILAEGAGVLILEKLDRAKERGAKIYAEILGVGMSADATHLTKPDITGAKLAIQNALENAQIEPSTINYINAHGTGTKLNDKNEIAAIKSVSAEFASSVPISSTKSIHGHALGATGLFEAVATILGLHNQILPPTANFLSKDPDCDVDSIPNVARPANIEVAMSNSFAFGGLNAVVIFKRWDE